MTAASPSDEALLTVFANGDPQAAQELTRRLAPRAFGLALRTLGDRAEAEDIAQEAMMRLWRIAPNWQGGGAQVSTWLYRVTLNLCLDHKRRQRHRTVTALDDLPEPADPGQSAPQQIVQAQRIDALQGALLTLPDRQRQAVILRHLEELSNPQIAEIMDISTEAVESLTARGKRALSAALADKTAALGYSDD